MSIKIPFNLVSTAFFFAINIYSGFCESKQTLEKAPILLEAGKKFIKDPLSWPSIWRTEPELETTLDQDSPNEKVIAPNTVSQFKNGTILKNTFSDWRTVNEKRTNIFLEKIKYLEPENLNKSLTPNPIDNKLIDKNEGQQKFYLSQEILIQMPTVVMKGDAKKYFPHECKISYNSNNDSEILQPYDEIIIQRGQDVGSQVGDLYVIYEIGPNFQNFSKQENLGNTIQTKGIAEIVRTGTKSSIGRVLKIYGTISKDARARPLDPPAEVSVSSYSKVEDDKLFAQIAWIPNTEQFLQPFSYVVVDKGSQKGYKMGDMVLFFNRLKGKITDKVLGNGLVVNVQEKSATILLKDVYPGTLNRGDFSLIVQTPTL